MPTILIVDPDPHIRLLLDYNLRSAGFCTVLAATGAEALSCAAQASLIITELVLADSSGLALCSSRPTIILSNDPSEETIIECLDAGADDFIVKPFSPRELVSRVKGILRRRSSVQKKSIIRVGTLQIDTEKYEVHLAGEELSLTNREYHILLVLAQRQGAVCTREEILSQVWKTEYYGDTRIVDVHMRHLRAKGVPIETIHGVGYRVVAAGGGGY